MHETSKRIRPGWRLALLAGALALAGAAQAGSATHTYDSLGRLSQVTYSNGVVITYVYDAAGTEYLDLYGGHAVISIGHAQPDYVRAVQEQVARLGFYSNSVENSLQVKLAERLGRISGYDDYRLFLCNSGAEANENALKLASFHTGRSKALAISKAFHGRTSGAVAVTDNPAISSPFKAGLLMVLLLFKCGSVLVVNGDD